MPFLNGMGMGQASIELFPTMRVLVCMWRIEVKYESICLLSIASLEVPHSSWLFSVPLVELWRTEELKVEIVCFFFRLASTALKPTEIAPLH